MEAGPAGPTDVDKRTSLPAASVGVSPESPSDPKEESIGVLPALRPSPEAIGTSSEANGPCPGHSPLPELLNLGVSSVTKAKGDGAVEVVWAGLRATENSVTGPTGVELEAKVEEMVLEAIGSRQGTSSPELPTWVKEGRGVVEVVWEGLGGRDPDVTGESDRDAEATHTHSLRLHEQFEAEISRKEEGASRDSPEGVGQGVPGGEEGSFIWVERVALSEDWEELLMEGLEAPPGAGSAAPEALMGAQPRGGETSWEVEKGEVERAEGIEEKGSVGKLRAERDGTAVLPDVTQGREESRAEREEGKDGEGLFPEEIATEEEKWEVKAKEDEEPLEVERGEEEPAITEKPLVAEKKPEGSLEAERKGSETPLDREKDGEGSLDRESKTTEILLDGETEGESSLDEETKGTKKLLDEETGGEGSLDEESKGSKQLLDREAGGSEPLSEVEKTSGAKEDVSPEEQGKSNEGAEFQAEDASQPGAAPCAQEEPPSEEQGLQDQEKQEGPVEEAARKPQPCAESEGSPGDATPLLSETPAPEQPVESRPLLHQEVSSTNPGDHPAPIYAPAQQLELAEAKEASGPKQKTCQCCVVM